MATEEKPNVTADKGKKRKQRFLPQNRPVKKKGAYPLRPGVQGFFLTCDGGREHQAVHEALNVIDSFYEELVHGKHTGVQSGGLPEKPINKKVTFSYSSDEDNNVKDEGEEQGKGEEKREAGSPLDAPNGKDHNSEKLVNEKENSELCQGQNTGENANGGEEDGGNNEKQSNETDEPPVKKPCLETNASENACKDKVEKSIDKLIEAELEELGDKNKRRFIKLDASCNGLAFIQMRKIDGDPSPKDIVQRIMTSAAATRKHVSRFILRLLPVEVACYASEDEISRAIKPLVERYFPAETDSPQKFAVMYNARANTGIDRMQIINAVAKSVPAPHKVDLGSPDKTIVVEVVKTVCLIGVVEKFKALAKYNLRQLTSPPTE